MQPHKPTILIYREQLLGRSETFILAQGEGLQNCNVHYAGCRSVSGLPMPHERTFSIADHRLAGRLREAFFRRTGHSSSLLRHVHRLDPCVIHAHFGTDGVQVLPIAQQCRKPLIVTYHGFDATESDASLNRTRAGRRYLRGRERLKQTADRFLAVSDFIRRNLIAQGFPEHKITQHYIGIDTQLFTAQPHVKREPIVLFVGRLVEKKGCEFFIRAMQEVQAALPESELVIVGDGPLRSQLEHQARQSLRRFRFVGLQTPEQIRSWMNRATVHCTPSITADCGDAEGFGIVFAEAQSMGLPVASFRSGGIPEAVAHGETGLLADEKDWRTLAKNIITLLTDHSAWQHMSRAGQERVRRLFDLRKQCAALEQIYSEVATANSQTFSAALGVPVNQ